MAAEYKIFIYDTAGVKQAELTEFTKLSYRRQVNEATFATFTMNGLSSKVATLVDKGQVEIWRRNADIGLDWYVDWDGIFRAPEFDVSERTVFQATCVSWIELLRWRYVAYYAATANRTQFSSLPIETIMKSIVSYNVSTNATTANGRMRTPNSLGVAVEADSARGSSIDWACAWANVLETLQKLAAPASGRTTGDFDVIKTSGTTREFRYYPDQRGTDRSATVTFALEFGNMKNARIRTDRTNEATAAIVAGEGEASARKVRIRTGTNYGTANDIEMMVEATDTGGTDSFLDSRGDSALDERRARTTFDFDVVQAGARQYGKDYTLGDKVRSAALGYNQVQKIVAVNVDVAQPPSGGNVEAIALEFQDV